MAHKERRTLVIGPPGSGKTYVSGILREQGKNTVDADLVEGLSKWVDAQGRDIDYPNDANEEWLLNNNFIWNKKFLRRFLNDNAPLYFFGVASNVFDMLDLFDETYFLKLSSRKLKKRLQHGSRKNPMGSTEQQRKYVAQGAKKLAKEARQYGFQFIDANKTPNDILEQIDKR